MKKLKMNQKNCKIPKLLINPLYLKYNIPGAGLIKADNSMINEVEKEGNKKN